LTHDGLLFQIQPGKTQGRLLATQHYVVQLVMICYP